MKTNNKYHALLLIKRSSCWANRCRLCSIVRHGMAKRPRSIPCMLLKQLQERVASALRSARSPGTGFGSAWNWLGSAKAALLAEAPECTEVLSMLRATMHVLFAGESQAVPGSCD